MRRRPFLATVAATVLACPAIAARPVRVLRIAVTNGTGSAPGAGSQALAQAVDKLSEGRLRVEVMPNSEAGGEIEAAQDMFAGALEMCFGSTTSCALLDPWMTVFDLPFLFRDAAHARAVLDGPIGARALARLEPHGVVGLAWAEIGVRQLTANQPVRRPADLAGLKLRVPQSAVMVASFKALGADVQAVPFLSLYGALASGKVQAQENPIPIILGAKLDGVQKYLCLTGHCYSAGLFLVSRPVWDSLEPNDQAALRAAAREGARASRGFSDDGDKAGIATLRDRGMTVVDDVDRSAFAAALSAASGSDFDRQYGAEEIAAIRAVH
jgi:tripartite ATP-independent transporter DctP family solute receptor